MSGNEYEPRDSRNVTGTATTPDGRWTNKDGTTIKGVPDSKPFKAEEATEGPIEKERSKNKKDD